jgi:transposase
MKKSKSYTAEFKEEAVKIARNSGKPYNQIARDLGIPHTSLHAWIKKDQLSNSNLPIENNELKTLKKENIILKEEREILKKALAIFSKVKS